MTGGWFFMVWDSFACLKELVFYMVAALLLYVRVIKFEI